MFPVSALDDQAADSLQPRIALSKRSVHFPIRLRSRHLVGALLALAHALERGDDLAARIPADVIARAPATLEVLQTDGSATVSATLRAKALASVLIDLARGGWTVSVDEGQVYVTAPEWDVGGARTSPDEVLAAKARVRTAMATRVQEEIETESVRRFILEMEAPRRTEHGTRSVLSLLAEGPALAASLRRHGCKGMRPYLQPTGFESERDPHTGLRYTDILRYFRYYWSFSTSGSPGRGLSFLIRDAAQPCHPVCGLISIASPVPRLSVRDEALGWTAPWLEAVVFALDFPPDDPSPHLRALAERWSHHTGASSSSLIEDVSSLLGVTLVREPDALAAILLAFPRQQRLRRCEGARRRLLSDLRGELRNAIEGISFHGFGFDHAYALQRPAAVRHRLEVRKENSAERWRESRKITAKEGSPSRRPRQSDATFRAAAREPLFAKKRAAQAANLLRAWETVLPEPGERAGDALRKYTLGDRPSQQATLTGGEQVCRGLRVALLQRQTRFVASQVADVSVCGAVPPYGPILGGKLAALAALSSDVAAAYHDRYAARVSEISSQMAGCAITRPADLIAMTTTSFYSSGSSQYERLVLPTDAGDVRWRLVGRSRGNGTLHYSARTAELLDQLLCVETGRRLVTGRFGEGPSERLRKIRDGLTLLGIDANELLRHGMPRLVYVAELSPQTARPGSRAPLQTWRDVGPSMDRVARFWSERWLTSRLKSKPEVLEEVRRFDRTSALLSLRLRPFVGVEGAKS